MRDEYGAAQAYAIVVLFIGGSSIETVAVGNRSCGSGTCETQRLTAVVEIVICVQRLVTKNIEYGPVEGVGSRFCSEALDGTGCAAILGGRVRDGELELLNCLNRG